MLKKIIEHQEALSACTSCAKMIQPVITCKPVNASIMLIGQAPGIHEAKVQKPFGWTAGKTLFKWFSSIVTTSGTNINGVPQPVPSKL